MRALTKCVVLAIFIAIILPVTANMKQNEASAATPVNPNLSSAARNVLNYIESLSGENILAGQHDKPGAPSQTFNQAQTIAGQYPALWGNDMGFTSSGLDTMYNRQGVVNEAIQKHSTNTLITLTWHMCKPGHSMPCSWEGNVYNSPLTSWEWTQIVTPGTTLYNQFIYRIDEAVPYLKQLRDANVPVLWRPFHEMNGNWFWWGGNATHSKTLYQIMYNRYVNTHELNNLIWVWNVDRPGNGTLSSYYPGSNYVDILSMDIYNNDFNQSYYNTMVSLAGTKPIALGEVGRLPSPAILDAQPKWTYFMGWTEHLTGANTNGQIQETYWHYRTITRNEVNINSTNLALNKWTYASSVENSSYEASRAVDGNTGTRWASAWNNHEWIIVDLGAPYWISRIKLNWEAAYARKYQIQVSNDEVNWTTVYTNENNWGITNIVNFTAVNTRYVKMFAYERATPYGYSLWELGVY